MESTVATKQVEDTIKALGNMLIMTLHSATLEMANILAMALDVTLEECGNLVKQFLSQVCSQINALRCVEKGTASGCAKLHRLKLDPNDVFLSFCLCTPFMAPVTTFINEMSSL